MKKTVLYLMMFSSIAYFSACGEKAKDNSELSHEHDELKHGEDAEEEESDVVMFTDEQVKNIADFEIQEVKKQAFYQVLKTSGQILSAPGDQVVIVATASGIVKITNPNLVEGLSVKSGQQLFSVSSDGISESNSLSRLNEAKAILNNSQLEYQRASELVKDKLISQKEYEQAKLNVEQAKLNYQTFSSGMSATGKTINTPIAGFVKKLNVQSGQYVEIGEVLATISQNKHLILRADVSQKYTAIVRNTKTASFTTPYDNKVYELADLNGKLISISNSSGENTFYVPVNFEFENKGDIIEGSFVEVYLKSLPATNTIILPISALIEEQGRYFVFVKLEHENEYMKKEVIIGASDGINREIRSGLVEGEKVVSKGAYALKLVSLSSAIPEHAH